MLDFLAAQDFLSAYVPYIHNTFFVVFATSSLIYLAAKVYLSARAPKVRVAARTGGAKAQGGGIRFVNAGGQRYGVRASEIPETSGALAQIPFLRGVVAFIMYATRFPHYIFVTSCACIP
jgi:hypothetical protein